MPDTNFPQWRDQNEGNNYPFSDSATLTNGDSTIGGGVFLDASIHPPSNGSRFFLSSVTVSQESGVLTIGDDDDRVIATAEFSLVDPGSAIYIESLDGRPAGTLISDPVRIASIRGFGLGVHSFQLEETEFVADVCLPMPANGVTGIRLPSGEILSGDVWLVGEDGVALSYSESVADGKLGNPGKVRKIIHVNVVGDPLFKRRLCESTEYFQTPGFIRKIIFTDGETSFECEPDAYGDIQISVNNDLAVDTVLRVRTIETGIHIEAVGAEARGVQNT